MTDKEKALIQDYKNTFGTDAGKRVYDDLMFECFMDAPAHCIDNVNETFLQGGMRAVGLYIKEMIKADLSKKAKPIIDKKQPIET